MTNEKIKTEIEALTQRAHKLQDDMNYYLEKLHKLTDLENGCIDFDDWTVVRINETNEQLQKCVKESKEIRKTIKQYRYFLDEI